MCDKIPDSILLQIFRFLENFVDLMSSSRVSAQWHRVSMDEFLWKRLFINDFRPNFSPSNLNFSWLEEYKRTKYEAPVKPAESLNNGHSDEVLHVSFSRGGSIFASCSKDGYIKIWISEYPCKLKCERNLKDQFGWIYPQNSQFTDADDLLLVSGVKPNFSSLDPASGDIAIFRLEANDLSFCCRIPIRPYDFFGCWYDNAWFLSGEYEYIAEATSATTIFLCKSSQEVEKTTTCLLNGYIYRFLNLNASSVRMVAVGTYVSDWLRNTTALINVATADAKEQKKGDFLCCISGMGECSTYPPDKLLVFTCGSKTYTPHQIGFKIILGSLVASKLDEEVMSDKRLELVKNRLKVMRENDQSLDDLLEQQSNLTPLQQFFQNIEHQADNLDEQNDELNAVAPDQLNEDILRAFFNFPDHVMEFNGHITGLRLGPKHRELYVNVRSWPSRITDISDPWRPPQISEDIEIRVVELETLTLRHIVSYTGHKGYTINSDCFFIFLDVSENYVASGSEDKNAYLWDRRFGHLIKKFKHEAVVNCVAFHPSSKNTEESSSTDDNYFRDQMMVTASDDKTLRIWRSKKALDYFQSCESLRSS
uniref:F-box domain-containing protein n=1 Tax=Romanomermis culicivorax TaxID=13658 RepID=A0A915IVE8_ROMCU